MIGIIWLLRKQHKTTAALVLLKQQMEVYALDIHIIEPLSTTTVNHLPSPVSQTVQSNSTWTYTMAGMLVAVGIMALVKYLHRRYRGHGTLSIEFTSGKVCAMVPVASLPMGNSMGKWT